MQEAESLVSEIQAKGGRAEAISADLGTSNGAAVLAQQVRSIVGDRLDMLVLNALAAIQRLSSRRPLHVACPEPAAVDRLIFGHESLLLSEPAPPRPTLPLAAQQWFELAGEVQSRRTVRAAPKPDGYVSDGLQAFL